MQDESADDNWGDWSSEGKKAGKINTRIAPDPTLGLQDVPHASKSNDLVDLTATDGEMSCRCFVYVAGAIAHDCRTKAPIMNGATGPTTTRRLQRLTRLAPDPTPHSSSGSKETTWTAAEWAAWEAL